jgi:hypothetical protein
MNSFDRGDNFEIRVYEALCAELAGGRLFFTPENCHIYRKKAYYSKDRGANIVLDLSIEVRLANSDHWSILLVCECKDYSGAVPINDLEEFKAKLDQITGKNVKGMLAVTGTLQRGALTYAKAHGIGVIRVLPSSQISWLLNGSQTDSASVAVLASIFDRALTYDQFEAANQSVFGIIEGKFFRNWHDVLSFVLEGASDQL